MDNFFSSVSSKNKEKSEEVEPVEVEFKNGKRVVPGWFVNLMFGERGFIDPRNVELMKQMTDTEFMGIGQKIIAEAQQREVFKNYLKNYIG